MMKKAKDADAMNFENEQQSRYCKPDASVADVNIIADVYHSILFSLCKFVIIMY